MGWIFTHKPHGVTAAEFLRREIECENDHATWEVLDVAVLQRVTAYMACRITLKPAGSPAPEIFAIVFHLKYAPNAADGCNFGWKDVTETMGPLEARCPKRILDLLTPTTDASALEWRKRCRDRLARPKPKPGQILKFAQPLRFQDGSTRQVLKRLKGARFASEDGGRYRVRNWADAEFETLADWPASGTQP